MGTGLAFFWLGSIVAATSALGINSFNPLPKLNETFSPLAKPIQNAPTKIKEKVYGNTEERTFTDYYFGGHKFATVITDNDTGNVLDCMLVGDREFIAYMVGDKCTEWSGPLHDLANDAPSIPIINVTSAIMDDWIAKCNGREPANDTRPAFQKFFSGLKNGPRMILKHAVIFPGTKWCGAGDVARDYDDLGQMAETDKCCRDHDHSVESIARGKDKYGLKNTLLYTMTKCPDDEKFNKCLHDAGSVHAAAVGTTYFNILKTKCFDKRKRARCAKKLLSGLTPCSEYVYDENSPQTWQIFDASPFVPNSSLPMQKINGILHAAPGLGDFLTVFS